VVDELLRTDAGQPVSQGLAMAGQVHQHGVGREASSEGLGARLVHGSQLFGPIRQNRILVVLRPDGFQVSILPGPATAQN